ncbi:MAG: tyrosine-type recombinase/integrase [Lachnospiraceae bacterium]
MGKDLRGKELGVGICQTKNKKYVARFTNRQGKRVKREFVKLQDCRNWISDAQFCKEHGGIDASSNMSVSAWFEYWITEIKGSNVRLNTIRNYSERFKHNIEKNIGNMLLNEVKPMHCQNVLNQMTEKYRNSTIIQTRITLYGLFQSAVENELLVKNPVMKAVKCTTGKESKPKRVLSVEEQKLFLETVKYSSNYNQYAFLLQTGLRTGEMIGLKWSDIDFNKKNIHISRTMEYRYSVGEWRVGEPKSKSGYRDIPLTQEALQILKNQKEKLKNLRVIPFEYADMVFLCRNGTPTKNSAYDTKLFYYCDKINIPRFSMHTLRHTFATRCIEAGMKPKTLQMILGHSNIGITMNLYVHITEEEKIKEIESIEKMLNVM